MRTKMSDQDEHDQYKHEINLSRLTSHQSYLPFYAILCVRALGVCVLACAHFHVHCHVGLSASMSVINMIVMVE